MLKNQFVLNRFISVYTDINSDLFGLGYVVAVDESYVLIASVTPNGFQDGLTIYKLENICKVEEDTQYNNKILKLMSKKKIQVCPYHYNFKDILNEILLLAKNNERILQIQLQNSFTSSVSGIVKKYDKLTCEIMQYDLFGQPDGICKFLMEDITSIKYDGEEIRNIELLKGKQTEEC